MSMVRWSPKCLERKGWKRRIPAGGFGSCTGLWYPARDFLTTPKYLLLRKLTRTAGVAVDQINVIAHHLPPSEGFSLTYGRVRANG